MNKLGNSLHLQVILWTSFHHPQQNCIRTEKSNSGDPSQTTYFTMGGSESRLSKQDLEDYQDLTYLSKNEILRLVLDVFMYSRIYPAKFLVRCMCRKNIFITQYISFIFNSFNTLRCILKWITVPELEDFIEMFYQYVFKTSPIYPLSKFSNFSLIFFSFDNAKFWNAKLFFSNISLSRSVFYFK